MNESILTFNKSLSKPLGEFIVFHQTNQKVQHLFIIVFLENKPLTNLDESPRMKSIVPKKKNENYLSR